MTNGPLVLLFPLELEYDYFIATTLGFNCSCDFCTFQCSASQELTVTANSQNFSQFNSGTRFTGELFHFYDIAGSNTILLPAIFNDCVHRFPLISWHTSPGATKLKCTTLRLSMSRACRLLRISGLVPLDDVRYFPGQKEWSDRSHSPSCQKG